MKRIIVFFLTVLFLFGLALTKNPKSVSAECKIYCDCGTSFCSKYGIDTNTGLACGSFEIAPCTTDVNKCRNDFCGVGVPNYCSTNNGACGPSSGQVWRTVGSFGRWTGPGAYCHFTNDPQTGAINGCEGIAGVLCDFDAGSPRCTEKVPDACGCGKTDSNGISDCIPGGVLPAQCSSQSSWGCKWYAYSVCGPGQTCTPACGPGICNNVCGTQINCNNGCAPTHSECVNGACTPGFAGDPLGTDCTINAQCQYKACSGNSCLVNNVPNGRATAPANTCSTNPDCTPSWWQVSGGDVYGANITSQIPATCTTNCYIDLAN